VEGLREGRRGRRSRVGKEEELRGGLPLSSCSDG
jgi:hypothetical protein